MLRALLIQALGDFFPFNGMYPGKVFGDIGGFIGLDGADKMPDKSMIRQGLDLFKGLLEIIFAKVLLSLFKNR